MKGMSITSEIIMALGMIVLAVVFSLVSSQIIGGQQSGIFSDVQNEMATDIAGSIDRISSFEGSTQTTYEPPVDLYTLNIENGQISLDIEGENSRTVEIQAGSIETNTIEDADFICISRGDQIRIDEGRCETIDTSELCSGGGCSPNQCQPDLGETCRDSGCSCGDKGGQASSECAYDHDPNYDPDYISPAGDPDPVVDLSCINKEYVGVQDEGERCEYNFECSEDLYCNPSIENSNQNHCCPSGEEWTGNECKPSEEYHLVYVPARYNSQSKFEADANEAHEYILDKAPFKQCSNPSDSAEKTLISRNSCNIQDCDVWSSTACFQQMRNCVENQVGSDWDKIVGLAEGIGPSVEVNGQEGVICGKASSIPSDISVTYSDCGSKTAAHELGHTYGLFHVETGNGEGDSGCRGPNKPDCKEPDKEDFLMSYADNRIKYGPAGYNAIENVVEDSLEICS